MPNWRKVIVADQNAFLNSVTTPSGTINDITASYAINASTTAINSGTVIAITPASTTWTLNHSVNERYPIVTCWESGSNEIIQPNTVRSVDINTVQVTFTVPVEGFANVSRAGHVISGSQGVTLWTQLTGPANITASLNVLGGFTGSLAGTASYALNAPTAATASYALTASFIETASNAISSSFAHTASYWSGSIQNATSASIAITASYALASLTASYAVLAMSASHLSSTASNALTASYSDVARTASFATTASYWSGSIQNALSSSYSITASYVATVLTASHALTASYWSGSVANATSASVSISSSWALSASYAPDTTFPYIGTARITGSLQVSGSATVSGSLTLQDVLVAQYLSIANYSGDDEAAAAGIPLWGIYRTGNMLVVRMT